VTEPCVKLRRRALLAFPGVSFHESVLDQIVVEGFDDIVLFPVVEGMLEGQGYTVARAAQFAALAQQRGLGVVLVTGYMKYEHDLLKRQPQRAMLTRGPGATLDSDSLPSLWLCPFRPENQQRYRDLLREAAAVPGITELHLNDEAMLGFADGTIGCYCDHCLQAFAAESGAAAPGTPDWTSDLWWRWIEFRMRRWTQVHAEFRAFVRSLHPALKVGIQHSPIAPCRCWQPWKTAINVAADAAALDVVTTDPYHFNHADVISHRPHRRILAEGTRSLVGACGRADAGVYPQGFMPPAQAAPMGRQDGILAGVAPFALGARSVTPYTYELMKIIPGFSEGFADARRLLPAMQQHRPYATVTMLYPLQSEIRGHWDQHWGSGYLNHAADLMYHSGLPWRWLWDEHLAGDQGSGPLIVPEAHCLTAAQLQAVASRDGVLYIGHAARAPWSGAGPCPLPTPLECGRFVLDSRECHAVTQGVPGPLVLRSRAGAAPFDGVVAATCEGRPALVLREDGGRRRAWLAGLPVTQDRRPDGIGVSATGNLDLFRRLVAWLAREEPTVRLDPWPALDAYRAIRPADVRCIPTAELLPMVSPRSLLAIVLPYTPVAFDTHLLLGRPARSALDLWTGAKLTITNSRRIPIHLDGDADLVAALIEWDDA
jgi:hypothetical protein